MLSSGPQLSWVPGLPPAKSGPGGATIDEDRDDRQSDTAIAATHRHTECSRGRHTSNTSTSLQLAVHAEPAASYPRHSHREHSTEEGIHHHRYTQHSTSACLIARPCSLSCTAPAAVKLLWAIREWTACRHWSIIIIITSTSSSSSSSLCTSILTTTSPSRRSTTSPSSSTSISPVA